MGGWWCKMKGEGFFNWRINFKVNGQVTDTLNKEKRSRAKIPTQRCPQPVNVPESVNMFGYMQRRIKVANQGTLKQGDDPRYSR